ncbi:MAG: heavy metal-binding domain-containing protein [Flavobacteriaceae bacterium]
MRKAILSLVVITTMVVSSCTTEKKTEKQEVQKEEVQKSEMDHDKMAVAEYQCPMKCEGDKTYADKDHKCPVCKMDLKEVKHEDGKNHDMDADKKSEENHDKEDDHDKD